MAVEGPTSLPVISNALLNRSGNVSMAVRFRALFALKALALEGNNQAVDIIAEGSPPFASQTAQSVGFKDESELLKHELAYVLGQTGNLYAIEYLEHVLDNPDEQEIVRHEVVRCFDFV
jgi:deoxyhypusine monooxygenase